MSIRSLAFLVAIGAVLLSIGRAEDPTTKTAQPPPMDDMRSSYTRQLGSDDPIEVEAAIIGLSRLPPAAFPAIVASAEDSSVAPKARSELKKFIDRESPWQAARQRIASAQSAVREHIAKRDLSFYEKFGKKDPKKDPKWDAAARETIRSFALQIGDVATRAAAEQAMSAGCDDPLILYIEARMLDGKSPAVDADQQLYERAATDMFAMHFPPDRMVFSALRAATYLKETETAKLQLGQAIPAEPWERVQKFLRLGLKPWPAFVKYSPSDDTLLDAGQLAVDIYAHIPQGRKVVFDAVYERLQAASPDSSVALTFKGYSYIGYAWDARGDGWAREVTPEHWKLMAERLEVAEAALTQAWELDNTNFRAANLMIQVELGQGRGRDRMELWFKRAMEANPDDLDACNLKMYYLEPKWYGTPQDMLAFGHECFLTHNWRGNLPFKQVDAIAELRSFAGGEHAFLSSPEVWKTLNEVYEPFLRFEPKDPYIRSAYCNYACLSGHWDVARQQFLLLGSAAMASQFGGDDAMKKMQSLAQQNGARK